MPSVELCWTTELTRNDYAEIAVLCDSEYAATWGPWDPRVGYGYARGELHALVRRDGQLLGYAASARRFIGVGAEEVLIAGTGGVLTRKDGVGPASAGCCSPNCKAPAATSLPPISGSSDAAKKSSLFYEACGFTRVEAPILDVSPKDAMTVVKSHGPTLICPGTKATDSWPEGTIDLRGLPW